MEQAKSIREQHMVVALTEIKRIITEVTDTDQVKLLAIKDVIEAYENPGDFSFDALLHEEN